MNGAKRSLKIFLSCFLFLGTLSNTTISLMSKEQSNILYEEKETTQYAIYPVPQSISYGKDLLVLSKNINIVVPDNFDVIVKGYIERVLKGFQFDVSFSNAESKNALNVYISTAENDDFVNDYFAKIDYHADISTDVEDGYALSVNAPENFIAILGNNASSVFNAISTLSQMLTKSTERLADVLIEDSPNTKFRGIVEGFYGEYKHEERMNLIQFIGPLKMNTYIYGAKFDAYHNEQWRDLYPEDKLTELGELVQCGKENNVEVVWTAHVGGHIDMGSEEDYQALINKFDQLYRVGVRQFGLFYDDASTDNTHLIEFINRINREYVAKKEGVKNLIFCPQSYNKRDANEAYLRKLAEFDKSVQIMWTGDSVISDVSPSMMEYIESMIERPAYIWWNYPVNDLAMGDQLLIGETVGLSTEMKEMNGLVSNPMLQPQSTKFALFSIADYSWNIDTFDQKKSWNAAVEYIIEDKAYVDAFKLFAANNNQSQFELKDFSVESDYFIALFNDFRKAYYEGEDGHVIAAEIAKEFERIEDACALLLTYNGNPELMKEARSWIEQLQKVVNIGKRIIENVNYLNANNVMDEDVFMNVISQYEESQSKMAEITSGRWSGRREIIPFLQEMQSSIHQTLMQALGDTKYMRSMTNCRGGDYLNPDLSNMIDRNEETFVQLSEKSVTVGRWAGVDLGYQAEINKLEILLGSNEHDTDVPENHVVQISNNGVDWKDIAIDAENNCITNTQKEYGRFIRYYIGDQEKYNIKFREFSVNKTSGNSIITNVDGNDRFYINKTNSSLSVMGEGNIEIAPDDYIGIQLEQAKMINSIDYKTPLDLEYSIDNIHWYKYNNEAIIARYVRLINQSDKNTELELDQGIFTLVMTEAIIPEHMSIEEIGGLEGYDGSKENVIDGNRDTYHWTTDQIVGKGYIIDLGVNMLIKDIGVYMSNIDWMNGGNIDISSDKASWETVGKIVNQQANIAYPDKEARYVRVITTENAPKWLKISEIEINHLAGSTNAPIVSESKAEDVVDKNLITGFSCPNEAGSFEFNNYDMPQASQLSILKSQGDLKLEIFNGKTWEVLEGMGNELIRYSLQDYEMPVRFRISWGENSNIMIKEIIVKSKLADYSNVDEAIAKANSLDKTLYKDFSDVDAAIHKVVRDQDYTKQAEVDAMAQAIYDAINALVYKDADYRKVNDAIAEAKAIDRTLYTEESLTVLDQALAAVIEGLDITKQAEVDAMAQAIYDAINALVYKDADYRKVNDAIAEAKAINRKLYTEESLTDLDQALAAVIEGLDITKQAEVDAMAQVIYDTIDALVYKDADYSKVNDAIAEAKAINRKLYTEESLTDLDQALAAVIEGLDITKQAEVDAMAQVIYDTIDALVYKDADYSKVNNAIAEAKAIDRKLYTEESLTVLDQALAAVIEGLDITKQAEVDKMAEAIYNAIDKLFEMTPDKKEVDKSKLQTYVDNYNKLSSKGYETGSWNAFKNVLKEAKALLADENATQEEIDAMINVLIKSYEKLVKVKELENGAQTFDGSQIGLWAILMMLSGGAFIVMKKRKEE